MMCLKARWKELETGHLILCRARLVSAFTVIVYKTENATYVCSSQSLQEAKWASASTKLNLTKKECCDWSRATGSCESRGGLVSQRWLSFFANRLYSIPSLYLTISTRVSLIKERGKAGRGDPIAWHSHQHIFMQLLPKWIDHRTISLRMFVR